MLYPGTSEGRAAGPMLLDAPNPIAASLGGMPGEDAVVLAVSSAMDQGSSVLLDLYDMRAGDSIQHRAGVSFADLGVGQGSSRILIGDIDPELPGMEIVVARANHHRRGVQIRVFTGLEEGDLRQICAWTLFRRRGAQTTDIEFALADALPARPGKELLVSSPSGRLYIFGLTGGRRRLLGSLRPFPDRPQASAARFAVADLIADNPGNEVAFADDGARGDGLVRILDPASGAILAEAEVFPRGEAAAGVELWAGNVSPAHPGAELIAGQGSLGGRIRVFSLATRIGKHLFDLPDPLRRATSHRDHLVVADLLPGFPAREIAVAQASAASPVQVFAFDGRVATLRRQVASGESGLVTRLLAVD